MVETLQHTWNAILSIPHLGWYLSLLWVSYLIALGMWIVLQKREPAATLSWVLGLAVVPFLGFLIYHVFGPQRIHRQRLRRKRSRVASPPLSAFAADSEALELARLGQATTGLASSSATDVRLLIDGGAKFAALLADVAAAQRCIDLEYYIYLPDNIGTALRDALIERARHGVKVRVLLDAVGSGKARRGFFAPLIQAGGQLAWFHPMRWYGLLWRPWLNLRTHRKIVVIDDRIAYTGGINIADIEDERTRSDAYRDLHLRIEGQVVRALQLVFAEDWAYATGTPPILPPQISCAPGEIAAQVLSSGPDTPWEAIHRLHVGAIHAARQRIWLVTPYFVPGEAAMMSLTSAALAGLDVRLIVPKLSDSRLVTWAARSYFDDLLAAGVRIYEYGPRMLHSKALLIDDELALIGTANFDHRSFRLNFEVCMLFRNRQISAELAELIAGECAQSGRVDAHRTRALLHSRLPEALARLLSPLL